ncbi:hypothetical protein [Georgenia faecalis]|uniref:Uncharacterized protein n=1 Tax=Georgenia faecalis TaxID=2483799 RepID=A0ABV9DAJ3_9MICO|nr:hypothetical protein [Georgenia faecalis]
MSALEAAGLAVLREAIQQLFETAESVRVSAAEPVLAHGDIHVVVKAGPARAAFGDAYGPVDGDTELRARALAVHVSATLLDYAVGRA